MDVQVIIVIVCAIIIFFQIIFLSYLFMKKKDKNFKKESQAELHPQLLSYVKEQILHGYDKKLIRAKLLETGWDASIVDSVMKQA